MLVFKQLFTFDKALYPLKM